MGGLHEHRNRNVPMSFMKSIGKLLLTSSQLQTVLTEAAAISNTRTLVCVDKELKTRKIISPMQFSSINSKVGLPATEGK